MPKDRYTFDEFVTMLKRLDRIVGKDLDYDPHLNIFAIGGFSMMYNYKILNIGKSRDESNDIDSMMDIEPEVQECITKAGKGDGHWLNNEWYRNAKNYNDELFDENEFVRDSELGLKNIKLYVANIKTLLSFKIRALQCRIDDDMDPRPQDVQDITYILDYLGTSKEEFRNISINYNLYDMYPQAMDYVLDEIL